MTGEPATRAFAAPSTASSITTPIFDRLAVEMGIVEQQSPLKPCIMQGVVHPPHDWPEGGLSGPWFHCVGVVGKVVTQQDDNQSGDGSNEHTRG